MKEQVTDIPKVLQDMTEEMRLMRETINQQYAEIVRLNRNIDARISKSARKTKKSRSCWNACPSMKILTRTLTTAAHHQARNV